MKRGLIAVYAIFFGGGALLLGGAAWSYLDEHSGTAVKAHVTRCVESGSGPGSTLICTGTWSRNGRAVTGSVYNARKHDVGKTLDVRLHGGHASRPQLWVSIALAIFGLIILGMGFWLIGMYRRAQANRAAAESGA
jgi:hypothetical protein